jgi:phytoene synthase
VIDDFVDLAKRLEFDLDWIEAFLASMEMDLHKKEYATMDELLEYIHGSAEVIGLMMAKIMRLPEESYKTAGMLGRSMQYINFLRDIQEDLELGRTYIPLSERSRFGFTEITEAKAKERKEDFIKFFQAQIEQYEEWDNYARKGFSFLPKRFRIPIKTAADMYRWTAKQLKKNPFLVFERKVKPGKRRILFTGVRNFFS